MSDMSFDHIDLKQVDPNFNPLPTDTYKLRVVKAGISEGLSGPTAKNPGAPWTRVDLQLSVLDHPDYTARRVFADIWPGDKGFKQLRRIADATGIQQDTPGREGLEAWLQKLATTPAEFLTKVEAVEQLNKTTGETIPKNILQFREVAPIA